MKDKKVDDIVCLGDVAEYGPEPHEVIERLKSLSSPVVMGNEDQALLEVDSPRNYKSESDKKIHKIDKWTTKQLSESDLQFIRSFKPTVEIQLSRDRTLLCCHGSPRSNTEHIYPMTALEEIEKMFSGIQHQPSAVVCGHTHLRMLHPYLGSTFILNPGSVGLPFQLQ